MSTHFSRAIVRPPSPSFADGLTSVDLGYPDFELALSQHRAYCAALEECGLELKRLEADPSHPDSTFVEDTAILTERGAILMRPGAPSRAGEVAAIRNSVGRFYSDLYAIESPGTVDGGDILEADNHFFIGLSKRTNEEGARQLTEILERLGYGSSHVDIRGHDGILHLKSGVAHLGGRHLVVIESLAEDPAWNGYELVRVGQSEDYAANCVRVNERVLVAAGFPAFEAELRRLGYRPLVLEMSEFQKMDGGLSCLSLRF